MSRGVAWHYLMPRVRDGWTVLDVGAGDSPFTQWLLHERHCRVTAVDIDADRLRRGWMAQNQAFDIIAGDICELSMPAGKFDAVLAVYSIGHMIGREPMAWVRIRKVLKPGGTFLCLARYQFDGPRYEGDRGDPLFGQNESLIRGLATLCLFDVVDMQVYRYKGDEFEMVRLGTVDANAIGFQLKAIAR